MKPIQLNLFEFPVIGCKYMYTTGSNDVFEVESYNETTVRFKGGHWCTDIVFRDFMKIVN